MAQYAKITTTVIKTYGKKGQQKQSPPERKETYMKLYDLVEDAEDKAIASLTRGVNFKISDSAQWGSGDWDKIPYSVEVFSSCTLQCSQTEEMMETATELAHEFALEAGKESMVQAVAEHVMNIKENIFPRLFRD